MKYSHESFQEAFFAFIINFVYIREQTRKNTHERKTNQLNKMSFTSKKTLT